MSARGLLIALAITVPAALLAGCGEEQKPTIYKQGKYQGKPDTPPWNNEQFKGDEKAWDDAVRQRAQNQNEYLRMGGGKMEAKL